MSSSDETSPREKEPEMTSTLADDVILFMKTLMSEKEVECLRVNGTHTKEHRVKNGAGYRKDFDNHDVDFKDDVDSQDNTVVTGATGDIAADFDAFGDVDLAASAPSATNARSTPPEHLRQRFSTMLRQRVSLWMAERRLVAREKGYSKMESEMLDANYLQNALGEAALFAVAAGLLAPLRSLFLDFDLDVNHEEFYVVVTRDGGVTESLPVYRLYEGSLDGDFDWSVEDDAETTTTPLHAAVAANRFEAVKLLVNLGADVNAVSRPLRETSLHLAGQKGVDGKIIRFLVEAGADSSARTAAEETPLPASIRTAEDFATNRRAIEALMEIGSPVDGLLAKMSEVLTQEETGCAPPSFDDAYAIARSALSRGADPNETSLRTQLPLVAVAAAHFPKGLNLARLLLNHGATLPCCDILSNPVPTSRDQISNEYLKARAHRLFSIRVAVSIFTVTWNCFTDALDGRTLDDPRLLAELEDLTRQAAEAVRFLYSGLSVVRWHRDEEFSRFAAWTQAKGNGGVADIIASFTESVLAIERTPRSLAEISRAGFRDAILPRNRIQSVVEGLPLPSRMKRFLQLEEDLTE